MHEIGVNLPQARIEAEILAESNFAACDTTYVNG